ncbi:MAG TPA: DUF262 domain-containing protein [Chloroflexia bacterium]|jgi:hypothetical protein
MKISEMLDSINRLDMVMPEFQREYVWTREQASKLLDSLFKEYPTGSLLFWKTDNPPEIKNMSVSRDKIGMTMVILDGQQRLTTLYLLTRGEIPPYYTAHDITNDPRNLYFDLETGDFQYYQPLRMKNNPTWVPVTSCFSGKAINPFELAKHKVEPDQDPFELAQTYNENLTRLRNILERDYPYQTVPPAATIVDAITIFDLVNSQGTRLTDADLALTHITAKWPQARQVMKNKILELESKNFAFDLTFMVRSLVGVVKGRALFETIHSTPAEEVKVGWSKLNKILDYLVGILRGHAHIHSTEDLNTTNVFVPAIVYLARHNTKFPSAPEMRRFIHWMYAASTWARYSGQTNQRLDHDISIVQRDDSPWKELVDAIIEQRGRIEVKPSDLEGRGIQTPYYRMTYVMAKARGAIDWFNGLPLDSPHGSAYTIHSHHIFPVSLLYKPGRYDPENYLHKQVVGEIANRAFLTSDSNITLSNTEPTKYLAEIEKNYPGALAKQFIPTNPELWALDRYEDFLAERRRLIANAINERMAALISDLQPPKPQSLEELIAAGESPTLELKSSLRWDLRTNQVNTDLQKVIAKTVAGLMNSEGGILLIGVADDGTILGIENDLKTLKPPDRDRFHLVLRQLIVDYLGAEFSMYIQVSFREHNDMMVCQVRVDPSPKPVYLADKGATEFYIRAGNTTRPLDIETAHDYINMHWQS